MADSFSTTSLRAAFKYPFHSPEGVSRFLVGVALLLFSLFVPILPAIFVYGYVLQVMRRIIEGEPPALPEWKNWGRLGIDGLRGLVASVVYLGPGLVVLFGGGLLFMILYLSGINLINNARDVLPSGIAVMLIFGATGILFLSLFAGFCLLLIGGVPLPMALAHMAVREKLGAAFSLFEWGAVLASDRWGYFISWVMVVGLASLIQFGVALVYFTIILIAVAYVVILPLSFYLLLVAAAVFAQVYREGAARLAATAPAVASAAVENVEEHSAAADTAEGV